MRIAVIVLALVAASVPDLANRHADPDATIDSGNVASLALLWKIETKAPMTHRPIVDGGQVYFADWSGAVYAADAATGNVHWKKEAEQPNKDAPWRGFCGTGALGEGLLFEASAEGNAFALDACTGDVRWKVALIPHEKFAGNCGAMLYHDGRVYVGISSYEEAVAAQQKGFEPKFRGQVIALQAKTGKEAWCLELVDAPGTGVPVWSGFAVDPATDTLYFTTGNNYTGKATKLSDSIVAVEARTGKIRWSRQLTGHDVWTMAEAKGPDYDFAAGPQLFEARRNGRVRKLVGAGQKSGVYHALDRETGETVWQTVVGHGEIAGGIMADASVGEDRLFVWSNHAYEPSRPADQVPLTVKALDLETGAPAWVKAKAQPAGVTSAGFLSKDVYFVASLDGRVVAYKAGDGEVLWTSPAGEAPIGSSLTVSGNALFLGRGVPKMFGGKDEGGGGLFAYGVPAAK